MWPAKFPRHPWNSEAVSTWTKIKFFNMAMWRRRLRMYTKQAGKNNCYKVGFKKFPRFAQPWKSGQPKICRARMFFFPTKTNTTTKHPKRRKNKRIPTKKNSTAQPVVMKIQLLVPWTNFTTHHISKGRGSTNLTVEISEKLEWSCSNDVKTSALNDWR